MVHPTYANVIIKLDFVTYVQLSIIATMNTLLLICLTH